MQVLMMVQGVDQLTMKNGKGIMHYAFGYENAPATLRQPLKFPLNNGFTPKPGEVIKLNVREVGESRGSLWIRGDITK